jgi:hypothetical protein
MRVLIAAILAAGTVASVRADSVLLADLPDAVLDGLRAADSASLSDASEVRRLVLAATATEAVRVGLVTLRVDPRWFLAVPPDTAQGPFVEARRWPGDSVVAWYVLGASVPADRPPLPQAEGGRAPGSPVWRGAILTAGGPRAAAWIDRTVPDTARRLGILVVPGDAGLGAAAVPALLEEAIALADDTTIDAAPWSDWTGPTVESLVALPRLLGPPVRADERRDVWQATTVRGFSIGLPPGVRSIRTDGGVLPPRNLPGGLLWFRGHFVGREGNEVQLGDPTRAGYLALPPVVDRAWISGERPPLGASTARRVIADDFSDACTDTGADAANAERWNEPGRTGDWLVFRLLYGGAGIEIGLPVLAGRQSEALYWIPATLRPPGWPPAAPPLDPQRRFGIDFDPYSKMQRSKRAWAEGLLTVPGLRLEVPRGWRPIANLRSSDGLPVTFVDEQGELRGTLSRLEGDAPERDTSAGTGWKAVKTPSKKKPTAAYRRADGARLFVTAAGVALLLFPEATTDRLQWDRMADNATPLRDAPSPDRR